MFVADVTFDELASAWQDVPRASARVAKNAKRIPFPADGPSSKYEALFEKRGNLLGQVK